MAANRPKRHKPEEPPVEHNDDLWTLKEKRRLQRALLKYSPKQVDCIAKIIETKRVKEVRAYLDKMEEKLKNYAENRPKEAIELWSTLGSDLISCEVKDYSEALSEVMSVAAHLEEHPKSTPENDVPNYGSIYKYIAAVLNGEDLPFLGKLESAIVLDMMHGLMDTLRTHDTTKQQEIMLRKYHLLTSKIDLNNTMLHVERCRKAINNDYSDFKTDTVIHQNPSKSTSPPPRSTPSASAGAPKQTAGVRPSTSRDNLTEQIHSYPVTSPVKGKSGKGGLGKRKKALSSPQTNQKKSKLLVSQKSLESESDKQNSQETDPDSNQRTANTRNSSQNGNNIGQNSNYNGSSAQRGSFTQSSTDNSSSVTRDSLPGTSSINSPETLYVNAAKSSSMSTSSSSVNSTEASSINSTEASSINSTEASCSSKFQENDTGRKKESIPKKPALFTLNPFCIPIDMLKFQRLVSSEVAFKPVVRTHQMVQRIIPRGKKSSFIAQTKAKEESQVEIICVDEKQDIIRREKFISMTRHDVNDKTAKD